MNKALKTILDTWRDCFIHLSRIAIFFSCGLTWAALFSNGGLVFDLPCHFRLQYAIAQALFLAAAVAGYLKNRDLFKTAKTSLGNNFLAEVGLAAISLVLNLFLIGVLYLPANQKSTAQSPVLRCLQINVNTRNQSYGKVAALVHKYNADVVALQEIDDTWLTALKNKLPDYPYVAAQPRPDNFGIAIFSRLKLDDQKTEDFGSAQVPTMLARLEFDGAPVTVVSTHPLPPVGTEALNMRNEQLKLLGEARSKWERTVVLMGDLNSTSWAQIFKELCTKADLMDTRQGFGIQPTWPTYSRTLWIPLDHCLVSKDLVVRQRKVCETIDSDHFPVYIELARRH
ncbi:MAG: endonuclease/exonuclease/phosphatase family protein [Candidatus Obscuribacter sp.]|nr:endonuclease/exonuclease/phosphatase family protein [Candidatus Obscuribacter sp.]MBK9276956.1 endonuclease/exonuclease/phosphatase family protein [Candidatus Obscuribacter sp.]